MNRYGRIRAFHQREECCEGLQLEYDGSSALKEEIFEVIDDVTLEMGMIPKLYQNSDDSISIAFHDEYDREERHYFTNVLRKLGIAHFEG
ncbi:hypothetical protein [Sulfurimonas sp. HSL3-7]|uniref:hypothetical protein n=1 Tax=Sulfonitrofixus jiaomeiensis TaxID=3131938 RepID=UPI0031F7648D